MKPFVYALGDIHGDEPTFKQLLKDFDVKNHQLVLLGDLLDRGPRSKACLELGRDLVLNQGAIYLKGNHEDLLVRFLTTPEDMLDLYVRNGGDKTLESLLHKGAVAEYSATEMSLMIQSHYPWLRSFLTQLPAYFEWHDYVFVHAGVDLERAHWQDTRKRDFIWIREAFHQAKNQTNKTIVFGHTPTSYLYGDNQTSRLWQQDNKIGMDGGGIYGGSIHGVIFSPKGIVQDIEYKQTYVWQADR